MVEGPLDGRHLLSTHFPRLLYRPRCPKRYTQNYFGFRLTRARDLPYPPLVKFNSQIVSAASGSVGGCTFSRNRFGQYVRRRSMPVNPGSAEQNVMTAALSSLVASWKSLTLAAQTAWINYALNTPRTDSLGNPILLTGQQMYISLNTPRIQVGAPIVSTAPVVFGGAILTPPSLTSLVAATGILTYTFNNTDTWATAVNGYLVVFISRPQSPSTQFFKGPYRLAGVTPGAVVPPTSPGTETSPFTYAVGQRAHVQFRALNATGQISAVQRQSIIAT